MHGDTQFGLATMSGARSGVNRGAVEALAGLCRMRSGRSFTCAVRLLRHSLRGKSRRGTTMLHRRDLMKLSALGGLASVAGISMAAAQSPAKPRTRIVFLGTKGGPRAQTRRSQPPHPDVGK